MHRFLPVLLLFFIASGLLASYDGFRGNNRAAEFPVGPDTLALRTNPANPHVGIYGDMLIYHSIDKPGVSMLSLSDPGSHAAPKAELWQSLGFNASACTFSSDDTELYYSLNGRIHKVDFTVEGPELNQDCSFSDGSTRDLQPTLSADASLMIFASDRAPSEGGLDLLVVRRQGESWGKAESLGAEINTSGHECYPHLDSKNNLWFSSTGHRGYGSYDIYLSLWDRGKWGKPINLGPDLNTSSDELALCTHEGRDRIFFSRQQRNGKGALLLSSSFATVTLERETHITETKEGLTALSEEEVKEPAEEVQTEIPLVIYRVQLLARTKPGSTPALTVDNKSYPTYEYYYKGAYRITIGEFSERDKAEAFRLRCTAAGFKQAFVAAFLDGKREIDPELIK